jgi:cytochrome c oxidase subunit IV
MPEESRPPENSHPIARPNYVRVFVILALLTAVEVGVTYLPLPRVPILVPLALLKAGLVVLYYMHLKFDRRIFSTLFSFGLLIGLGLLLSLVALFAPPLLDTLK